MKKVQRIVGLVLVIMLALSVRAFAMSQSELIDYICKAHAVNGTTMQLSEANKVKVERYLAENPVTEAQAEELKAKVDEVVTYIDSTNVTDLSKLSGDQKTTLLSKANSAAAVVGVELTYSSTDKAIEVYKDGKKIESVSTESGKLVQTGSANYEYVVIPAAIVVLTCGVVFIIRKKVNA